MLRNFLRQRAELEAKLSKNPIFVRAHPQWLLDGLFNSWGSAVAIDVLAANNQQAPMTLRVNQLQGSRDDYLAAIERRQYRG